MIPGMIPCTNIYVTSQYATSLQIPINSHTFTLLESTSRHELIILSCPAEDIYNGNPDPYGQKDFSVSRYMQSRVSVEIDRKRCSLGTYRYLAAGWRFVGVDIEH